MRVFFFTDFLDWNRFSQESVKPEGQLDKKKPDQKIDQALVVAGSRQPFLEKVFKMKF